MKSLVRVFAIVTLVLGCLGFVGTQQAVAANFSGVSLQSSSVILAEVEFRNPADAKLATEFGQKIDLNNANVRAFREYRGFYPTLARKIVANAPYENVEDVLDIPGLSDSQKDRLQANMDSFTVTPPTAIFLEGAERFNNGQY